MPITRHAPALLYPKHLCLTPAFVACRDALLASPIILHEPMAALRRVPVRFTPEDGHACPHVGDHP